MSKRQPVTLRCGHRELALSEPVVMGILNITPDSFSDGGKFLARDAALAEAQKMVDAGAEILDVGGESTRPGARAVNAQEELDRVAPVIEAVTDAFDKVVSIDTSKPEVMRGAVAAGANLINDVRALRMPGALEAAASLEVPVCVMHMQGEPGNMQDNPQYDNVVSDVSAFLAHRIEACVEAGISRDQILVDPGFGFGKNLSHNLQLLQNLDTLLALDAPLLVGMSRKSMIAQVLDVPLEQRLAGSLACAVMAAERGAAVIRVHDVLATVEAIRMYSAVVGASQPGVNTL
ncbi:MAG: dihydropteroate synthase [Pseudomonadota bacterium]